MSIYGWSRDELLRYVTRDFNSGGDNDRALALKMISCFVKWISSSSDISRSTVVDEIRFIDRVTSRTSVFFDFGSFESEVGVK